ncbi:S8 family serine peptidase [Alkalihalophilus pseudofirmus]|uniref:S8 family peptidase n=1 Tax=Alkalihalophilus pseudofirmus TaxID=79885 RepID=UPI00259B69B0|nr:S8 family serine peptidase [Alkalihalophilus pseudofirmus]WEG16602.1 S8 family serine peptidase [Alkalihalophilus pseudofirmus]
MFRRSNKTFLLFMIVLLVSSLIAQPVSAAVTTGDSNQERLEKLLGDLGIESDELVSSNRVKNEELRPSEDTLVIKYSEAISNADHQKAGATLQKRIPTLGYDVVKIRGGMKLEQVAKKYAALDSVISVQASVPFQQLAVTDPKASTMYHLNELGIEEALKLTGDHAVTVGVIDSGLDRNHPELKHALVGEYNVLDPLKRPQIDSHGTHVAGIIAGEKGNEVGGYGVYPDADIYSIDVFNRSFFTTDFTIAEGILHAVEKDVDVINMSIGSTMPSSIIQDAIDVAVEAGIVLVAAAGNNGSTIKSYPGAYAGVINVGATDQANELAWFSSYGPALDVVAPGNQVYAPMFDVDKHSTFEEMSGTSMASPIVAGVAAMLKSKHPDLTSYEVMYILQQTATDLGAKGYDTEFGFGMVNPKAALSFDVSKLPSAGGESTSTLSFTNGKAKAEGSFRNMADKYLYRIDVREGELLQFKLEGSALYDLAIELTYEGSDEAPIVIDKVREGEIEAVLHEALMDGTIVAAVYDTNEHYRKDSTHTFTLEVERADEYLEDGLTVASPIEINRFPFATAKDVAGPLYLAGPEGDQDYFRFTSDEGEVVEITIPGVPGIDTAINVYFAEEFDMFYGEREELEEYMDMEDVYYDEYGPYPMYQDQSYGVGVDTQLTFETIPGMEYVVEVTTRSAFDLDPFMFMFFDMFEFGPMHGDSSHLPYQMNIRAKVLPEDEDGYPNYYDMPPYDEEWTEEEFEDYRSARQSFEKQVLDYFQLGFNLYLEEEELESIVDTARELDLNNNLDGYFQRYGDFDFFKITPEANGLYQLNWNKAKSLKPLLEVFKLNETEEGETYLTYLTQSGGYNLFTGEELDGEPVLHLGLEEGETYLVAMGNNVGYGQPSLEAYELSLSMLRENIEDAYWKNDDLTNAAKLPNYAINANLSMTGRQDVFYYKAKEDGVAGFHFENLPASQAIKSGLPENLFEDILPLMLVIEDTNGDGEITGNEEQRIMPFMPMYIDEAELRGSFRVKSGAGYFIAVANDSFFSGEDTLLTPYRLQVSEIDHTRAQPQAFRAVGVNSWRTTGFLPVEHHSGRVHQTHSFTVNEPGYYTATLDIPSDLDGMIKIIDAAGQTLASADHYGKGDREFVRANLAKGTYSIVVQDTNGDTSLHPYYINIDKK